ncbi:hypothetical protein B0T19DRAFT_112435 [Cercophora scortea]|uniref:Uncharacterized protein n=1 Tax=Cercophora scortea TaxID=314031 RepID=A0AAE0IXD5_9PEZI|nr:hypothetical protein B0T19DRAFT_112435 [Cercophora scortea]
MKRNHNLPRLAAATALALMPWHLALAVALPQAELEVVPAAPSPWVTVAPDGSAQTITPITTTTNNMRTTISPAPDSLLAIATYTLSPSAGATTYTGLAPVATATDTASPAGAFLACNTGPDVDAPFCLPKRGSSLYPGQTYYITWAVPFFGDTDPSVQVQFTFDDGLGYQFSDGVAPNEIRAVPASQGFLPWTIPATFLSSRNQSAIWITLSLEYDDPHDTDTNITQRVGPRVQVINPQSSSTPDSSSDSHVNAAAIAVPVILAVIILLVGGLCFRSWRKTGVVPLIGGAASRRQSGYGERRSRSERVGGGVVVGDDKPGAGIQLTDRDSWSPTAPSHIRLGSDAVGQGRTNVFREEVERQQRQR